MKRIILSATAILAGLTGTGNAASITAFSDETNYANFLGTQTTFIDFAGTSGPFDGVFPEVDFNTIDAFDPDLVSGGEAITDAGNIGLGNGVGRLEGLFSSDVFAIGMELTNVHISGVVAIFDSSDGFIGSAGYSGNGFVGISSDMAFARFEIQPGEFDVLGFGTEYDRVFIDDFRINNLTSVPLPASGLILLAGLATLRLNRREKAFGKT